MFGLISGVRSWGPRFSLCLMK